MTSSSDAPVAAAIADRLAEQAAALIRNWTKREVPRESWYRADDLLCDMHRIDPERAERAMIHLAEQYERWLAVQVTQAVLQL